MYPISVLQLFPTTELLYLNWSESKARRPGESSRLFLEDSGYTFIPGIDPLERPPHF